MFDCKAPHPPRNANGGWRAKYIAEFDFTFGSKTRYIVTEDATIIDIGGRNVNSEQFISKVIPVLERCEDLEELDVGNTSIEADAFEALVTRVISKGKIPNLRTLDISGAWFDCALLRALLLALSKHCPLLDKIRSGGVRITDDFVLVISQALPEFTKLTNLYLAGSPISDIGLAYLARATKHHSLRRLDVGRGRYTADGIAAFIQKMHCSRLEYFYFEQFQGIYRTLHKISRSVFCAIEAINLVVALCSVTDVPRLGKRAPVRVLSKDMLRCVARTLFRVQDISGFWQWHALLSEGLG